jgi:hypothetical protein
MLYFAVKYAGINWADFCWPLIFKRWHLSPSVLKCPKCNVSESKSYLSLFLNYKIEVETELLKINPFICIQSSEIAHLCTHGLHFFQNKFNYYHLSISVWFYVYAWKVPEAFDDNCTVHSHELWPLPLSTLLWDCCAVKTSHRKCSYPFMYSGYTVLRTERLGIAYSILHLWDSTQVLVRQEANIASHSTSV